MKKRNKGVENGKKFKKRFLDPAYTPTMLLSRSRKMWKQRIEIVSAENQKSKHYFLL